MTDEEYKELEELRAFKIRYELTEADRQNPNVLLLEGELSNWEGNYSAMSVLTKSGRVYLVEVISELKGWKDIMTFSWHISSEPLGFYELEEHMIKTAMGETIAEFRHSYSELTGYLWTTEQLECAGHDIFEEITSSMMATSPEKSYIAMRVERNA